MENKIPPHLHEWLKHIWIKNNHPKYRHYFDVWVVNLTQSQIEGFSQMEQKRNIYEKQG